MNHNDNELLPCPFCGGEAKFYDNDSPCIDIGCGTEDCPGMCGTFFCLGIKDDKEKAVTAWNRRPKVDDEINVKVIAERIQAVLDGDNPMAKWEKHTGVKDIYDLRWLVKSNLREAMILQGAEMIEKGADYVKAETEIDDFVLGKQAAYKSMFVNLQTVIDNMEKDKNNDKTKK